MFGKKEVQSFDEYIFTIPNEKRLIIMNYLSNKGDPNEVLNSLINTPPCLLTKKIEVRINEKYMLFWKKETLFRNQQMFVFKTNDWLYCYHSLGAQFSFIGLIDKDDNDWTLPLYEGESVLVFEEMQKYVNGFEKLPFENNVDKNKVVHFPSDEPNGFYYIKGDTLYYKEQALFTKKITEYASVKNINDIIMCHQYYSYDSENVDTYAVEIYVRGEKELKRIYTDSTYNGFKFIMELKKRVPHLLYSTNKEYIKLFKTNPFALLALAKLRMEKFKKEYENSANSSKVESSDNSSNVGSSNDSSNTENSANSSKVESSDNF